MFKKIVKKIIIFISRKIFLLLYKLGGEVKVAKVCRAICIGASSAGEYFFEYRMLPKKAEKIISPLSFKDNLPKGAVVMQGNVISQDSFTLESVKLYKKIFPTCEIIVSTCDHLSSIIIDELEKAGAYVICCQPPENTGLGNINYQIENTMAGLRKAQELGAKYVMKTRSDFRLYRKNLYEYLIALLLTFPVNNIKSDWKQNERIIVLDSSGDDSSLLHSAFVSDWFFFGDIEDIINYFSQKKSKMENCDKERWRRLVFKMAPRCSIGHLYNMLAPECYLYKGFLGRNNVNFKRDIEQYWDILGAYFIGVSWDDLGIYSYKKEEKVELHRANKLYFIEDNENRQMTYGFNFHNWLIINKFRNEIDEKKYNIYDKMPALVNYIDNIPTTKKRKKLKTK